MRERLVPVVGLGPVLPQLRLKKARFHWLIKPNRQHHDLYPVAGDENWGGE